MDLLTLLVILFAFVQAALGIFLLGHFVKSAWANYRTKPSKKWKAENKDTGPEGNIPRNATLHSSPGLGRRPGILREGWRR